LGRYNEEQFKEDEAMLESEMKQESLRRKSKKLDSTDLPYFEIFMKDGTLCDLVKYLFLAKSIVHGKFDIYQIYL